MRIWGFGLWSRALANVFCTWTFELQTNFLKLNKWALFWFVCVTFVLHFFRFATIDPEISTFDAGWALLRTGKNVDACVCYRSLLEADPKDKSAILKMKELSWILNRQFYSLLLHSRQIECGHELSDDHKETWDERQKEYDQKSPQVCLSHFNLTFYIHLCIRPKSTKLLINWMKW